MGCGNRVMIAIGIIGLVAFALWLLGERASLGPSYDDGAGGGGVTLDAHSGYCGGTHGGHGDCGGGHGGDGGSGH